MGYTAGYSGAYGVMIPEGRFVLVDQTSLDWEASDIPVGHFILRDYTNTEYETYRESNAQWDIASATSVVYTSYVTTSGAFVDIVDESAVEVEWYSPRQSQFGISSDSTHIDGLTGYRESSAEYYVGDKTYLKYIGSNLYYRNITAEVSRPQIGLSVSGSYKYDITVELADIPESLIGLSITIDNIHVNRLIMTPSLYSIELLSLSTYFNVGDLSIFE